MQRQKLNVFFLVMINLATILSIKNWPISAELGLASAFYLIFAALIFFVPVSLVAAELASGWPEKGGVFVWVKEALGHNWGFLAVWLLWLENIAWYPTILSFIAGTIAYVIDPYLAQSKLYTFGVIFVCFWGLTFINLRGIKISGWISAVSMIFGTLLPGLLIIGLGMVWIFYNPKSHITFSWKEFIPDLSHVDQLSILAGILLGYGGMEMPAVHARDVVNPKINYPKAIFISAAIIVVLWVLGSLSIAAVIPHDQINLLSGGIEAISVFFAHYHLTFLIPVIATLIAFGALGGVSTWIAGPCRGLLAAAEEGDLPPVFHRVNKHQMPYFMMITQGVIVTLLSLVFLIMPDVSSSFWILIVLASQLYIIMYALMFISVIVLRYKRRDVVRVYRIPGGRVGVWVVALVGLTSCVLSFGVGFIPPPQVQNNHLFFYESFITIGIITCCLAPFSILLLKKKRLFK